MKTVRIQDYGRLVIHKHEKYKGTVDKYLMTENGEILVVNVTLCNAEIEKRIDSIQNFRIAKWIVRCNSCGITVDNQLDECCSVCGALKCSKPTCQTCTCNTV